MVVITKNFLLDFAFIDSKTHVGRNKPPVVIIGLLPHNTVAKMMLSRFKSTCQAN